MAEFALVWQEIGDSVLAGKVVGTDIEIIEETIQKLQKSAKEEIKKLHLESPWLADVHIINPKLLNTSINVTLSYFTHGRSFVVSNPARFEVTAVHGETEDTGCYICYLPFLDSDFYYYNPNQLNTLVEHFAKDFLDDLEPEDAHRYIQTKTTHLEKLELYLPDSRDSSESRSRKQEFYKTLSQIAEKQPYSRAVKRKISILPETAWERGESVQTATQEIYRECNNLLLIGESGIGKSVILSDVSKILEMLSKREKSELSVWKTTARRLLGNAKYLGEWQENCDELVNNLEAVKGILWVTDVIEMLKTGGSSATDSVAAYLTPYLREGKLRLMGEMTSRELESARNMLPGFIDCFRTLEIPEMDHSSILRVINLFGAYVKNNWKISISSKALELSYRLTKRYIKYEHFPAKCIRLLGSCVKAAKRNRKEEISEEDVINAFIDKTGLPEILIRDDLPFAKDEPYDYFQSRIIGQKTPVDAICSIIHAFKTGLNDPEKPISVLLFAGPTGVGKTFMAKTLAEYFFKAGKKFDPFFRIDSSEFQHPAQIGRLIGVNEKSPGKLIQHVRNRPFSVILLDEIEKADPSFFDILLTIMDEGRFVDALGRIVDFRSSILIMTTNLGTDSKESVGFGQSSKDYILEIKSFFRPEFFNRINQILQFQALSGINIEGIAEKELELVGKREGITKRNLKLRFTEHTIKFIGKIGFSSKFGARPLQRSIEQHIVSKLSAYLLQNPLLKNVAIEIDYLAENIHFKNLDYLPVPIQIAEQI